MNPACLICDEYPSACPGAEVGDPCVGCVDPISDTTYNSAMIDPDAEFQTDRRSLPPVDPGRRSIPPAARGPEGSATANAAGGACTCTGPVAAILAVLTGAADPSSVEPRILYGVLMVDPDLKQRFIDRYGVAAMARVVRIAATPAGA